MSTCLILGGTGFIGSQIARLLLENGYSIRILSDLKSGTSNVKDIEGRVEIVKGDFLDRATVKRAVKDVDFVFHSISTTTPQSSVADPVYDAQSNVIGTIHLLQDAVKADVKKIIFASSGGAVYGEPAKIPVSEDDPANPVSPYGISKLSIEKYMQYFNRVYGLDYTVFRYSNPYGEGQYPSKGQGVIPIFLSKVAKGEPPVIYGDGSITKDYVYVKDVIGVNLMAVSGKISPRHHVFNIGSGKGTSLNDLVDIISAVVGKTITPEYVGVRKGDVSRIVLDITRVKKEYGWEPRTPLEDGIRYTWDWIKQVV